MSHDGFNDRFNRVKSCSWNTVGENVAYNYGTGSDGMKTAVHQWAEDEGLPSLGHRMNMLGGTNTAKFSYVGCAAAINDESGIAYYTAEFIGCF